MRISRKLPVALVFATILLVHRGDAGEALQGAAGTQADTRISPEQARELFRSIDAILRFDASDTGLAIHHEVKHQLLTRAQVIAFLQKKMDEDKDTARIEQSAIVLEKFGLLPEHFALRPFLLKLLGEQVAGFYDSDTKTVNLLDWVDAETQKPVLAHELTHALQDQFQSARGVALDKWENAGPDIPAKNVAQDRDQIRYDETDTAREAVLEGQAMVAYFDWGLEGRGQTLRTLPDIPAPDMSDAAGKDASSPVLDSAPLVLRDSLLFPYSEGLMFEQHLLKDRGTQAAFADVLKRPPETTWEILHPERYEHGERPPLLAMPDLHPLLDPNWAPYDVGVMGALDVRMLAEALADKGAGADAALAWDGGLYYAAQSRAATGEAREQTASIALVYLSRWKTPAAAAAFAALYRASLGKRYPALHREEAGEARTVDTTGDGPVQVEQKGRFLVISHPLPVPLARQVEALMIDAENGAGNPVAAAVPGGSLTAPLRRFLARQGVIRARLAPVY